MALRPPPKQLSRMRAHEAKVRARHQEQNRQHRNDVEGRFLALCERYELKEKSAATVLKAFQAAAHSHSHLVLLLDIVTARVPEQLRLTVANLVHNAFWAGYAAGKRARR